MKKVAITFLITVCCISFLNAKNIDIGLFSFQNVYQLKVKSIQGEYLINLEIDSVKKKLIIKKNQVIRIKKLNNKIEVIINNSSYSCEKIEIIKIDFNNLFMIETYNNKKLNNYYKGSLIVSNKKNKLIIINRVYLEHYIQGVLFAEGGLGHHSEYYKVQALISRTYAFNNLNKHVNDGYNLCSRVHCQAYKGHKHVNNDIKEAVNDTENLIITDVKLNPITAAFYSNSGGQTANSEDVWVMPLPYLRSKIDSFSLNQKNYLWSRKINKTNWINYLQQKTTTVVPNDSVLLNHTPEERAVFYANEKFKILLKDIRKDWKLKSTNFSIRYNNEYVFLDGRGFGHGVGLSQEGAMNMANKKYNYKEILIYYYSNINIIPINLIDFYKE